MNALAYDTSEERDRRWKRTRDFMENNGLEALIVFGSLPLDGEPLDRYLSNWVPGCTVIFPLKQEPTLLVPMVPQIFGLRADKPAEEFPWIQDMSLILLCLNLYSHILVNPPQINISGFNLKIISIFLRGSLSLKRTNSLDLISPLSTVTNNKFSVHSNLEATLS